MKDINYFFRKDGKINSKKLKDFPNEFYQQTHFLNHCNPTLSQRLKVLKFNIKELPKCLFCNKLHCNFSKNSNEVFRKTCSYECSQKSPERVEKIKKSTDYEKASEKRKQTNLKKYGSISPVNIHEEVEKKYGVKNSSQLDFVKKKKKEKGTKKECYLKAKDTRIKNNNYFWWNYDWLYDQIVTKNKTCNQIAIENNLALTTIYNTAISLKIPYLKFNSSIQEENIAKEIQKFYDIERNNRKIIHPYEIDIFIPNLKLGIEYHGLYWHSEEKKDNFYHKRKLELARRKNIKLIQIFENEWIYKKDIVISIIKNNLNINEKIMGRKTKIVEISTNKEKNFFEENHLQGYTNSKICYGLMYEDEIVSCMSFGISRYNKNYQWELIRFANKKNKSIIGGPQKIFKNFVKKYDPESIITYSDNRYFSGKMYEKMNFEYSHETLPNYWYFKDDKFLSRYQCQKHKLKNILDNFDPNLTEYENMKSHGYCRIYDCGNKVWIWRKESI